MWMNDRGVVWPRILSMRERAALSRRILGERLDTVLPMAMRAARIDMWLVLCHEDNHDPVFDTLMPDDVWCPILQMLIFHDRGEAEGVEGINLSMTNPGGFYEKPWNGTDPAEQWDLLAKLVTERDPQRIGIDTGPVQWASDGLTYGLYSRLLRTMPGPYGERLVGAEPLSERWLATLCETEVTVFSHVVAVAKAIIAECYGSAVLVPGVTTATDLEWHYRQRVADLGIDVSFKPFFSRVRSNAMRECYGADDAPIRPGDFVHCDVGIRYLGLCSDHQQWAYVRRPGETEAPEGMRSLLREANRLQDVFISRFREGMTGNELLADILTTAREAGVPNPKVYSHSLGRLLHEPGPLIGLPWEQQCVAGRGDVRLHDRQAFTMELSVGGPVAEWDGQEVRLSIEEDVVFEGGTCRVIHGRQTEFHLL